MTIIGSYLIYLMYPIIKIHKKKHPKYSSKPRLKNFTLGTTIIIIAQTAI